MSSHLRCGKDETENVATSLSLLGIDIPKNHDLDTDPELSPLIAGSDDLVLSTILQFMTNAELYQSFMTANKRFHTVALRAADPAIDDDRPFRWSCKNGHLSAVRYLLQDERVDPGAKSSQAITDASSYGYVDIV